MLLAAFGIRASLLMTAGDAAASFPEQPDAQAENMSLNSKEDFLTYVRAQSYNYGWPTGPEPYSNVRQRSSTSVGKRVWTYIAISCPLRLSILEHQDSGPTQELFSFVESRLWGDAPPNYDLVACTKPRNVGTYH
ncbi:hypothetical protein K432DRAFT_398059 [Lepidopterella palustris CBS 459.81]|uniref:Uncharacterized protein n=1 Tax=Lepidopterella palustris CBS 459.81 TaxID=1314670 RepID=A0A8E2JA65_9PEZI|nr:hypothetical protein K432DRAFT_398059 [Lepidopterella palustris CBS 459.81]